MKHWIPVLVAFSTASEDVAREDIQCQTRGLTIGRITPKDAYKKT